MSDGLVRLQYLFWNNLNFQTANYFGMMKKPSNELKFAYSGYIKCNIDSTAQQTKGMRQIMTPPIRIRLSSHSVTYNLTSPFAFFNIF